jgi:putative transposase
MTDRPPRLPSFSYIGRHRYSLTFCVHNRRQVFADDRLVTLMLEQISRAAHDLGFAILAYCFMPDHLHLLVEAQTDDANLVKFAHALKQRTGFAYLRTSPHILWQKGYFDHVLRDDELTEVVARYILENPVRGGLCKVPREYKYSGSLVWSKEQLDDLWSTEDASIGTV